MASMAAVAHRPARPQPSCLYAMLQYWAEHTPDAPALLTPGRPLLTYGRLHRHIYEVGQTLGAMGLSPQDRVAVVLPHGPEMAVACLSVAAALPCAPLNPAYRSSEFAFYLAALRPQALLVQQGMDTPWEEAAETQGIRVIEVACTPASPAGIFTLPPIEQVATTVPTFATATEVALLLHTSGTTSHPKVVPLTHRNICTAADDLHRALALGPDDRCLNLLPFFHTYGLIAALLTSLRAGASVVCPTRFDITQFFVWLDTYHPTWYQAVPIVQQEILTGLADQGITTTRWPLRFIRTGTAPLPPAVRSVLTRVFQVPIIEGWGMVEAAGTVTCNAPLARPQKPGSIGVAIGPEVAIVDTNGVPLPAGTIGEIVVRGATVMTGYEHDPEANSTAFLHEWFRSGDAGYLDADGYLFLTGRIKEMINRGGTKIVPQEVEATLLSHPAVAEAVAFAVPHARLGEDVAAAVVVRPSMHTTERALRLFTLQRLTDSKVPRRIYLVEALPKTALGKLQRLGLADRLGLTTMAPEFAASSPGSTPLEQRLAELWAEVFGVDAVSSDDDFFRLGGDSLLAMRLLAQIHAIWQVELSWRTLFNASTVAELASRIALASQAIPSVSRQPLVEFPANTALPLSYAQQRLWFLEQLQPHGAAYHLPVAWHLQGPLHVPALEHSLREIVQRHATLRTTFPALQGHPIQRIAPELTVPLSLVEVPESGALAWLETVKRLATEAVRQPFDLTQGPLLRFTLWRRHDTEHVFLCTFHHMIFDGWSAAVFWRELATLYTALGTGQPSLLPALPCQYADYTVWQRQWLQGDVLAAQRSYWQQRLGDALPACELPTDRPRPPEQTFHGARQELFLRPELISALQTLSQQSSATLFMALVATFQTLLYRYTGQTDLLVGTPIAGRSRAETEHLLGFFVNTLVLRTTLQGNPRFRDFLTHVATVMVEAYDHQDLPFEQLLDIVPLKRDLSRQPLVQVMIAMQPPAPPMTDLLGVTAEPMVIDSETAKFDLTFSIQETTHGLRVTAEYSTDLFDAPTITRMLQHYHSLVEGVVAHPDATLLELPLLRPAERQALLASWQRNTDNTPTAWCLQHRFESQAERYPDAVAVVCDTAYMTYRHLNAQANRLAHYLRTLGVGPEVCVGLCIERCLDMIVGMLAILKAGGAYVPLDPGYPAERLATMIADARLAVLLTRQRYTAAVSTPGLQVVCFDLHQALFEQQGTANPVNAITPANLAYVLYTSGSTGQPKGVMVEHRQVSAFLDGFERVAPGQPGARGTAVCPFGFDVFVWECFSMLCSGGTLHLILSETVLAPAQLAHYLVQQHITNAYLPPALLGDVVSHLEQVSSPLALQRLLVGVEPIPQGTLQRFRDLSASLAIINGYGPTESTICATLFPFHTARQPERRTPIGTPIHGYDVYVLDAVFQPVPLGVPGQLFLGGRGLARGYLQQPVLTAEHFIPHPFPPSPGVRLYQTGDLARYRADGNLEFLGRLDQQVKLYGYRVELAEIEMALRQHPEVQDAAVSLYEDLQHGVKYLVGYVVAAASSQTTPPRLRAFLQQKLPAYMVPSQFVMLDCLPYTPQGKLHRQALPVPDALPAMAWTAPRTAVERTLLGIWAEMFGSNDIGVHDNFFARGGDSIRGLQMIAKANAAGLWLTPKDLFQHQTIAELATVVRPALARQAAQGLVLGPVPLSPIQSWFFAQHFAEPHHWNQATLLTVQQPVDYARLERAAQYVLAHHDMLRARFRPGVQGWQQHIVPPQHAGLYMWVDLSWLPVGQYHTALVDLAAQLHTTLDLTAGPIFRVVLFDGGTEQAAHLLLTSHHLVIDSVSWGIVVQDLQTAYDQLMRGHDVQLPRKSMSFQQWLHDLQDYAHTATIQQEAAYWLAALPAQMPALPVDYPGGENTVATACTVTVALGHADTTALFQQALGTYRLHINEMFLTALAQAFAAWTGHADLLVDLEGHGRDELVEGMDVSRTVGWFTTLYPAFLQIPPDTAAEAALIAVKEQLRRIPRQGIGYGLLRYGSHSADMAKALHALPQAQVCWNYLGAMAQPVATAASFTPLPTVPGPLRSFQGRRPYLLEVNGRLQAGQLHWEWTYSASLYHHDTIAALAQSFVAKLQALIAHCLSPTAGRFTPADFPELQLQQHELDDIIGALGQFAEES